ncbi:hypothetical protein MTO96_023769 [Rhipicephalus appendiculatus]
MQSIEVFADRACHQWHPAFTNARAEFLSREPGTVAFGLCEFEGAELDHPLLPKLVKFEQDGDQVGRFVFFGGKLQLKQDVSSPDDAQMALNSARSLVLCAGCGGRTVQVVCASGRLTTTDPTKGHLTPTTPQNHAMLMTQASTAAAAMLHQSRACRNDSDEVLWSGRKMRFLIEKYKENFVNIGKDAVNEEFECSLSVLQVTNKWKSLERVYKRAHKNNKKSSSGTAECRFEDKEIPCSSFYSRKDPQTLNDILNRVDAGKDVPSVVAILQPNNYAAAVTDEESGDEEGTSMDHLPGSTLRAEVVDSCSEPNDDEDEEEPPAKLQKRHVKWDKRDLNSSFPVGNSCEPDAAKETPLTPVEAFEKFFDDEVINLLVENTNTYTQQKNRLLNVNAGEIKCFLGILLLSGYVPVPRRRMLWENSHDFHNELIANSTRRDRFEAIFTNLHMADNNNLVQEDKFTKLRPLFRLLNERFLLYAPLLDCFSIDESLCEYFGKHGCKQFPEREAYPFWL